MPSSTLGPISMMLAVGFALGGCNKPAVKAPEPRLPAIRVLALSVTGSTVLKSCDFASNPPDPTKVGTTVRIKLHEDLDDLIGATPGRRVHYSVRGQDSNNNELDYDNGLENACTPPAPAQSCLQHFNEIAPYNINLQDPNLMLDTTPQWVRVKIMIPLKKKDNPGRDSSISQLRFFTEDSALAGVTVGDRDATPDYICLGDNSNMDDGHKSIVLTLYMWSKARKTAQGVVFQNPMSVNINLVPQKGAIDTPIIIDPKWLNNG